MSLISDEITPMHIVLIGDSIFDNAPYVDTGCTVSDQLSELAKDNRVTLLAVDGDITTDVDNQLRSLPSTATHLFVSCGGNDALQCLPALYEPVRTVGEAMDVFRAVTESFRHNYRAMLTSILSRNENLTVCTIYNCIPELPGREKTALSIFNEIILEEAIRKNLPVIDLRLVCNSEQDYSTVSPIEPSEEGGRKISRLIWAIASGGEGSSRVTVHR